MAALLPPPIVEGQPPSSEASLLSGYACCGCVAKVAAGSGALCWDDSQLGGMRLELKVQIQRPSAGLLTAGLLNRPMRPVAAQDVPPNRGSCGTGFIWSAGVRVPRGGAANAYVKQRAGS